LVRLTPRSNVKPEPAEPTIPRKRVSDAAFGVKVEENMQLLKKPKHELLDKVPLAQVNRNTVAAKTEMVPASIPAAVDVEATRASIASAQTAISHLQNLYDRIQRKKKKTKTDITRMGHHATELARLRTHKADLDASLPRAASPIKRTASKILGKTESLPKIPPPFYNPALGAAAKPKPEPFSAPFPGPALPYNVKPAVQQNAIASGSKGPLARALPGIESDDEMDVDPVVTLNKYLHAIPNIAPIGGADHHDENGDYHGRGRDTFHGPQAKADELSFDFRFILPGPRSLTDSESRTASTNSLSKPGTPSCSTGTRVSRRPLRNWGFRARTSCSRRSTSR
jgi:hypothetical protein